MTKQKTKSEPLEEEADLIQVEGLDLTGICQTGEECMEENRYGPDMYSAEWQAFVMSQFLIDELNADGHPFVHGLRRVARKLLGPIVFSGPTDNPIIHHMADGYPVTTVRYVLKLLWSRNEPDAGHEGPFIVEFADVADVGAYNADEKFRKFPSSLASTRAEARCLRKALQLKKCAAEEMDGRSVSDRDEAKKILESDINFMDMVCGRIDVDVMKYINMGANKYKGVRDIDKDVANAMMQHLSLWQNDIKKIPKNVRGYKKDWRGEA